ncbi:FKBP-type peptidyl-prolyl cis-trans isomerase [Sphingomonas bacterium]|uniref:FKBP-type peptidyl-prolyl cis-trans isomerase n=1 Tax=Sphingomonas bacterium TaxID=1895847 RepID=UPI0015751DD7|nr:FKBP-type peptidyl-prolyl cis-trans isomerase [Sphingomonas bacterium]
MSTVTAVPLRATKRSYLIYLWAGVVLACLAAFALARQGDDFLMRNSRASGIVTTATGLEYKIVTPGQPGAPRPTDTDVALVNYEGKLLDGKTFDKSQQPTPMPVGSVVPGFSEALKLMQKGAKYRVWIPSKLGYGAAGAGPIPANATLMFDIELVDFLPASVVQQMQARAAMARGNGLGASGPGMQMPPGAGSPPQ